jgi:hypothetical protein
MSDVERAQLFLMDGCMDFRPQYPFCARCQHTYFDGPPNNATVDVLNSKDVQTYMWVCQQVMIEKMDV